MWEIRMKRQTNENGNKPVQNRGDIEGKVVPTNVRLNCKTTFPVETPPLKEQQGTFYKIFRKFLFKKEQKSVGECSALLTQRGCRGIEDLGVDGRGGRNSEIIQSRLFSTIFILKSIFISTKVFTSSVRTHFSK